MKTRGVAAAICAALLLAGCTKTAVVEDPAAAAASEAAKARESVPTTVPSSTPPQPVTAPPQPASLTKHKIYGAGRMTARCPEPKIEPSSLATVRAYYAASVTCLNKAWEPTIRSAGFAFTPPKLIVVIGQSPDSPCDVSDSYGYYCGDTIYLDAQSDLDRYREDPEWAFGWAAFLIAHEYGHHIQAITGISKAFGERALKLNGVDLALEESRRFELQASCFAGVYFGANRDFRPGWAELFAEVVESTGDPRYDHGNAKNHARWANAGFRTANPSACNTFAAPSAQVS
ncbi:hypothetical protein E1263_37665 [Kribbella antibiotica]|uniref:Metalloprotease n=1 Tax=Kribbella antibiotica TaxID=190195 RepID=A0A4R4YLR8_9ACTN|nr:neutral zinc metallopeptidase [Kribbella antibiotica]TDD45933.1 hypothetical protein E1263_37665 [Kribbella antibiotica]